MMLVFAFYTTVKCIMLRCDILYTIFSQVHLISEINNGNMCVHLYVLVYTYEEDPLEEDMVTHSRILVWRIPWTEDSSELQSIGLQKSDMTEVT